MLCPVSKMARREYGSDAAEDVVFSTNNDVGIITLNRTKALNALNLNMIRCGNSTFYKGLFISEINLSQISNPQLSQGG